MKLRFSDPVVVAQGPDSRQAKWGPYQFPGLTRFENGVLHYTFSIGEDSERAYGKSVKGCNSYASYDNGKTWTPAKGSAFKDMSGMKLPNGDRIHFGGWGSIPLEGLDLPKPIGHTNVTNNDIYLIDEVNPEYCPHTWQLIRYNEENPDGKVEDVTLNWPRMTIRSCLGVLVKPAPRGRLRMAPDGSLWMPHYYFGGVDPKDGTFTPYLANYLFKSTDNGKTWDLKHFLPFEPDGNFRSEKHEGFGENDITFTPDGSMFRLIRSSSATPCWSVRSEDGGETWSEPEVFDSFGVYPCLLTLGCGVTLASYGRPGVSVRATDDPSCKTWGERVELVHFEDWSLWGSGTCGYTNMVALDDRTAALVYSDWTVTDEYCVPHKCMMFRTITVED